MPLSNPKRRQAGLSAKRHGQAFEEVFVRSCGHNKGLAITRFPEGCKRVGLKKLIQVKTPWDWVVTHKGRTALLDTKSIAGAFFPHSAIEPHQIDEMLPHVHCGAIAGYVIWLRLINHVIFIPASTLAAAYGTRGSIGHQHVSAIPLGPCGSIDPTQIFL